jgi:AdoMet-dependent rRNA methyltransferase SPB1
MPANSLIVGVDLAPIKSIPRCITFQSDINSDKCRATLRQHLKTWRADVVLHDGAPNVGTAWIQDAYTQAELVLRSLKLATEFLVEGGTFVTKVFRSKDYNSLIWVFKQLFAKVEATKPPSSRTVSAEIFVVCRGFKAPKKVDPRFLDPRSVFADLADPAPNNEAKVFNPEKKRRKRDGYEEGDWTQYKEIPASEFIQTTDPIAILGRYNTLSFHQAANGDIALATLNKLPETTDEIRACCADLKVLGKKDFRLLLKWRLKVREIFGFSAKPDDKESEEVVEVQPMDEELRIQEDLQRLHEQEDKKKKKERRRGNEKKQKELFRLQMHMTTPMELGMDQSGQQGEDSLFDLKPIDRVGAISKVAHGHMHSIRPEEPTQEIVEDGYDSDSDGDALERQLDSMYERYQEQKMSHDAKFRVKRARHEYADDDWEGFSDDQKEKSSEDELTEDDVSEAEETEDGPAPKLISDLQPGTKSSNGLSRRANLFFDQDIFKAIPGMESDEDAESDVQEAPSPSLWQLKPDESREDSVDEEESFELEKKEIVESWEEGTGDKHKSEPIIEIITAEAMTLAHQLATRTKTKADMVDDNFNKYTFRDTNGLPDWFLDDENRHSKPQRPITAEAAAAIKEKLRALNARPIKKVLEAKARKKFRAARRLEKLRKKSALLLEDDGMTEGEKGRAVSKMLAKAAKAKPKRQVKVVVAVGNNRGISGRPKGTKGRYKMVDARMKKDMRAEKRLKKKLGKK